MAFVIGSIGNVVTGLNGMLIFFLQFRYHISICLSSLFHRLFWVVAFILSISCCVTLIYIMWLKWVENPVIISIDHRPLHISTIPFPATTICPIIKSRADIFNYTHVYRLIARLEGNDERAPNETEFSIKRIKSIIQNLYSGLNFSHSNFFLQITIHASGNSNM